MLLVSQTPKNLILKEFAGKQSFLGQKGFLSPNRTHANVEMCLDSSHGCCVNCQHILCTGLIWHMRSHVQGTRPLDDAKTAYGQEFVLIIVGFTH